MLEGVALRILQTVFGGGSNISSSNPLEITTGFGGAVYENEDTATADAARRFETSEKKLRDVIIQVVTKDQLFGDSSNQRYEVAAGDTIGFVQVDISELYFKNATAGEDGTVRILGTEE